MNIVLAYFSLAIMWWNNGLNNLAINSACLVENSRLTCVSLFWGKNLTVSVMLRLWQQATQLTADITSEIYQLERLKCSLYHLDREREIQLVREEYCNQCSGLCSSKITKLVQLNVSAKRLERVSDALLEVLVVRLAHPRDEPPL